MAETTVGTETAVKSGAPRFGATVEVQASHLAMLAKRFGLDPEKTTQGELVAAMKEFEREGRIPFTTEQDLKDFKVLFDNERAWRRANSKDKTLHRVVNMYPQFTGATSEDVVNCAIDNEEEKLGIKAIYKVLVERFEQKDGPDKKPTRIPLGSFQMDARKFLNEFEEA